MTLSQIKAAQDMMKLAINNQSHVDSLVGYYRDVIDNYNNQRAQYVLHYNDLNDTCSDEYLLQQQLLKQQQIISDLNQQLALAKAQLSNERMRYFKNMENNGKVKTRLQQTRSNYRQLMNSVKPIDLNNRQVLSLSNSRKQESSVLQGVSDPLTAELELQLINISKHHSKNKQKILTRITNLKKQMKDVMEQYQNRQNQNKNQYENALSQLIELQSKHVALTIQYFRIRAGNSQDEKKLQEQSQIYRLKNLAILQKLKNLEKQHSQEFKSVDNEVKKQNKKFKEKYDEELRKKEGSLKLLKQQHQRIQEIYSQKMKKLEQELQSTTQKLKQVEDRTRVQAGSLRSQVKILRARLEKQGMHQIRREIAQEEEDESSNSLEISDLQRINQEVKNIERNLNQQN